MSTADTDVTREMPPAPGNGAPPPPPAPQPQDEALSILQTVRQEHKAERVARTEVFVVPGYEDRETPLACRYGVIPYEKERQLALRLENAPAKDTLRELKFMMDNLIASGREFGVMREGEFLPLSQDRPVKWSDPRLVEGLGLAPSEQTARAILLAVFEDANGVEDAPYQIVAHHQAVVIEWMMGGRDPATGARAEADEEFAKNS